MGGFIAKQPNEKYCRFSSVVDCPTHINMTFDDYVRVLMKRNDYQEWKAREEAQDMFDNYLQPFQKVLDSFISNNMSKKEFNDCVEKMKTKDAKYEEI